MSSTAASPQDELPILSTHEGSENEEDDDDEEDEDDILMAIMRPARSIGRRKAVVDEVKYFAS